MDATTLGKLAQDVAAANEGQLHLSIAGVNTDVMVIPYRVTTVSISCLS